MDPAWRERIRVTWLGLGHLTFGACVMTIAIANAEQTAWSLPQFAFGGAIVTQGFLHLTAAWNIHPDPPVIANGPDRVGIRLAPVEQGDAALVRPGLVLQQDQLLAMEGQEDPSLAREVLQDPQLGHLLEQDPQLGHLLEQDPQLGHLLEQDPPLGHLLEQDPIPFREGIVQPLVGTVDQPVADDCDQVGQANDDVQKVDAVGKAGPANVVHVDIGKVGPPSALQENDIDQTGQANDVIHVVEECQAGPVNDVGENASQSGPANDVVQEVDKIVQASPPNNVVQDVNNIVQACSGNDVAPKVDIIVQTVPANDVQELCIADQAVPENDVQEVDIIDQAVPAHDIVQVVDSIAQVDPENNVAEEVDNVGQAVSANDLVDDNVVPADSVN